MPFHVPFFYAGLNYRAPAVQGTAGQVLALKAGLEDTEWIAQSGGGSGSPGGADTHIQINDAGAFFGEAAFAYNKTTNVVTVIGGAVVGNAVYNTAVKLNLTQPEDGFALIMGADASADSRTNATRKFLRVGLPHYLNAEEPVALLSGDSDGTDNIISIGGGFGSGNAATAIRFLTGANNITIVGTERMHIWPNGDIGVGLITPPEAKFDVSGTLRIRGAATFDATIVATSFNGVDLTTGGSATDFLNAQGNYVAAGGGGTPGGADTNVQINDGGVFFGEAAFSYNKTTNVLTVSGGFVGNLTGNVNGVTLTNTGLTGNAFLNDQGAYNVVSYANLDGLPISFNPSAHKTTHQSGGSDAIKLDDLAVPDDNTDLNASSTKHGLAPKGSGIATEFLTGNYTWAVPAGGGGGSPGGADTNVQINDAGAFFGEAAFSYNKTTNVLTVSGGVIANLTGDVTGVVNGVTLTTAGNTAHYLDGAGNYEAVTYASLSGTPATFAPSAHATAHQAGGGDGIKLDDLVAPDDNTDLDVSITKHGLTPKLPNDAAKFLNGVGGYTVPPNLNGASFGIHIGDGSNVISIGTKSYVQIPWNMTVTSWEIVSYDSTGAVLAGSIVVDVIKDSYANFPPLAADSIAGTEKPTLTAQSKNTDVALTSWSTLNAGDWVGFIVESATTVKRVTVICRGIKT